MQRVDGTYLYQAGYQIHALADLVSGTTTWADAHVPIVVAEGALEPLITRTVFQLRTSVQVGSVLLHHIRGAKDWLLDPANAPDYTKPIDPWTLYQMQNALTAFEAVLGAELALIPLYVVTPKSGMVLGDLIDSGQVCFPSDLPDKVPAVLPDVREATKCIAFELPTAAAFHLHRANEGVLRAYFHVVATGHRPPRSGNMGDYLKRLSELSVGDPKVIAALTQLKNLHRNPVMHPGDTLNNVDEAISLLGAVRSAMTEMLKAIPPVALAGSPAP